MKIYGYALRGIYKSGKNLCMDGFNLFSYDTSAHKYEGSLAPYTLDHIKRNKC